MKVLILLSGGLDSTLAVKIMLQQGADVEAVNFTTPFCLCDKCAVDAVGKRFGIKVHRVLAGQEYLDLVADPPHGYGSQMNPCIDCRILMLKKAKEIAEKKGATCIATGEVLNERPFSQRRDSMRHIEKEAGLEGKILRPLSAKLLPETEYEKNGLIDREKLFSIQGRRRLPQIRLAEEFNITDYPCPSGGCLLTDPQFAKKLKDFLKHNDELTSGDVALLKIGRHFRVEGYKVVVGRNKNENEALRSIAQRKQISYLEVADYMGPITLLAEKNIDTVIKKAAEITVRYSDAPKKIEVKVRHIGNMINTIQAHAAEDQDLELLRI